MDLEIKESLDEVVSRGKSFSVFLLNSDNRLVAIFHNVVSYDIDDMNHIRFYNENGLCGFLVHDEFSFFSMSDSEDERHHIVFKIPLLYVWIITFNVIVSIWAWFVLTYCYYANGGFFYGKRR